MVKTKDPFEQVRDCMTCIHSGHVEFPTINKVLCEALHLQYIPGEDSIISELVKTHILKGQSAYKEHLNNALKGGEGKFEVQIESDGTKHWLRIGYNAIPDQQGVHVSVVEDITPKKTLVDELQKLKSKGRK